MLVTSDDVKNMKPDPEGISKACDEIGVFPQNVIYVGDHIKDMIAAEKQDVCQLHADMDITMIKKMILNNIFMVDSVRDLKTKICKVIDERQR